MTIKEYNDTVYKQTKNADVFVACLDSAVRKSGHYEEVMKQLECIGWSEETLKVIRTALDAYRHIKKLEAQAAVHPAQTPLELASQLRKMGLSNGSALGHHSGVADEAADWIEAQVAQEQCGRLLHLPCAAGDTVYRICPQAKHIPLGSMWSGKVVKSACDRCPWSCCDCHSIGFLGEANFENIVRPVVLHKVEDVIKAVPYFGSVYFLTENEANAYLAIRERDANGTT